MTLFQAIILGIIQGATEFIPISSSGHLVLAPYYFGWNIDPEIFFFARELTVGARAFRQEADRLISEAAAHWDMSRMAAVDRNILRLAIYEMIGRDDIPERVAIDQAIEMAKRFGAAESGAFVNGILDHVLRSCKPHVATDLGDDAATGRGAGRAEPRRDYPDIKSWDEE